MQTEHHETVTMSALSWCITIAPVAAIATQAAIAAAKKRRKKGGRNGSV